MNILCHVLVNVDAVLAYISLDIVKRFNKEKREQLKNSSMVSYKQSISHFVKKGLLFDCFSPLEV